ncbi:MAG: hypothetical protein H0T19_06080 [Thermoleophilaceae bacterium]|nr:hypothetical protein [Thermoleophilaceae bacterium]
MSTERAISVADDLPTERLGHSSIGIIMDTSSHVIQRMQEEAAAKVAELIFE